MHTTRSDHIDIPIPSLIMHTISARLVCSETAYMSASPWHGRRAQWVKSKSEYLVHSERSLQETKQPICTPATLVMVSPHSTASFLQQLLLGISDYRQRTEVQQGQGRIETMFGYQIQAHLCLADVVADCYGHTYFLLFPQRKYT